MAVLTRPARVRLPVRAGRLIPPALALLALAVAFIQRPGDAYRDTRIELSVDPGLFLHRVASIWSPTTDLGHVQSGQWVGYLWPMAPWFSFWHWVGLPTWVAQRLWLGLLLGLAAWGAVRVMDELYSPRRGIPHVVAGLLFAFNPYVATYADRTATLLAYVALPWLIVAAHRGVRRPRGWQWPAVTGLVVASAGGGLNAALVAWVVAAPLALLVYEVAVLGRPRRDALAFVWRAAACVVAGSLWWAIPVLLQSGYGADFLTFTEQPSSILTTPSVSESVRLMGFWLDYFGVGYGGAEPAVPQVIPYLFSASTIVGTFAVPLLAFGALRWTRRWPYAPFFGLLGGIAVVIMALGFPTGSHAYDAVTWTYFNVPALQVLRTTYKVAPLLALALACLGGAGVVAVVERLRRPGLTLLGTRVPAWSALVLVVIPVLWARPFLGGHVIDAGVTYGEVPLYWRAAISDANRTAPRDRRIMVLPGETFGWYRWGGTDEPVPPALSHRPLLIRELDRYADPPSAQLQVTVDDLVQQGRLVPGQLDPLLRLMGVGEVLVAADGRRLRDGALDPGRVVGSLQQQPGFDRPVGRYGSVRPVLPAATWSGPGLLLPDLRRYDLPGAAGPGIVRVHPRSGTVILDGDPGGVAELAATGGLDPRRALRYAGDVDRRAVSAATREGAELVFTDSNRRRRILSALTSENVGPTLGPGDPFSREDSRYDPFPDRGAAGRTVAVYSGLRWIRANVPTAGLFGAHPQDRPYAAFDGRQDTAWLARPLAGQSGQLEFALRQPRQVPYLYVVPHFEHPQAAARLGVSLNGGPERVVLVHAGRNRIPMPGPLVSRVRLRLVPDAANPFGIGGALDGLAEVVVPGLPVREALRLPTDLASSASGLDLSHSPMSILLARTTTDFPYGTGPAKEHDQQTNFRDAEPGLVRDVALPAARSFTVDGWASVDPAASEPAIDRMLGVAPGWSFDSSGRFEGIAGRRASSAFDSDPSTAWVGRRIGHAIPWLSWRSPRPVALRRLRLLRGPAEYAFPARVRIGTPQGPLELPVGADGEVRLPRTVVTDALRLEITAVRRPPTDALRQLRAVAIGEIVAPGLRPPTGRTGGGFSTSCGALTIRAGAERADVLVSGSVADLDAGRPLRMSGCGKHMTLALPAGRSQVAAAPGSIVRPDHLRLASPAPVPLVASPQAARVLDPGRAGDGDRDGVRLDPGGPSWLVLGESYSRGWRAWCRDASGHETALGAPVRIDGFANGWPVGAGCREARFRFSPQSAATWAYLISALAVLAMLVLLVAEPVRRRRRAAGATSDEPVDAPPLRPDAPPDPPNRLGWPATFAWALCAGVPTGLLYGAVPGLAVAAILVVLGREGLSSRRLLAVAALALAALPIMYLAAPAGDLGGFNIDYARDHIDAHRVAAVAVACLIAACGMEAARLRARRRPKS